MIGGEGAAQEGKEDNGMNEGVYRVTHHVVSNLPFT